MTTTPPAGWYDDPLRAERLRYWDGHAWTEWVSDETGATSRDPVGAASPEAVPSDAADGSAGDVGVAQVWDRPAAGAQPARIAGPVPVRPYPLRIVARIAHAVVAAAGVLALLTSGQTIAVQFTGDGIFDGQRIRYESSLSLVVVALLMVAGGLVPVFVRNVWARMGGLLVGAGAAGFLSLALIGTTSEDNLRALDIRWAWWVLFAAAALGLVASLVAAVWSTPRGDGPDGMRPAGPFAGIGLGASIAGLVMMPLSVLGAGFGVLGMRDAASATPRRGSGLALAAVIVGAIVFALWTVGLLGAAVAGTRLAPSGSPPDASGTAAILFRVA